MEAFAEKGVINTEKTMEIALAEAKRLNAPLLVATTEGDAGVAAWRMAKEQGMESQLLLVSHAYGTRTPGTNAMTDENRKILEDNGVKIITAAHVLSGAERSFSSRMKGVYPVELIAHTLRMFSQGVKVAVEIGAMALDTGAIPYGVPVVAVGGTGRGADTVTVLTPAYTQDILGTKIHEILCKPYVG